MQPVDPFVKTVPTTKLHVQRRMHPGIADIIRITYPFLQDHPSTFSYPMSRGLRHRKWWLHHDVPEDDISDITSSITNMNEVNVIRELVTYLPRGSDYSPGDLAVLTLYAGQVVKLGKALSPHYAICVSVRDKDMLVDNGALEADSCELDVRKQLNVPMKSMLRLATIDNFQAEEAKSLYSIQSDQDSSLAL